MPRFAPVIKAILPSSLRISTSLSLFNFARVYVRLRWHSAWRAAACQFSQSEGAPRRIAIRAEDLFYPSLELNSEEAGTTGTTGIMGISLVVSYAEPFFHKDFPSYFPWSQWHRWFSLLNPRLAFIYRQAAGAYHRATTYENSRNKLRPHAHGRPAADGARASARRDRGRLRRSARTNADGGGQLLDPARPRLQRLPPMPGADETRHRDSLPRHCATRRIRREGRGVRRPHSG